MKRILITLTAFLISCGGDTPDYTPPQCSVDVFGDSLFYGPTLDPKPAARLQHLTGVPINDFSQSGRTFADFIQKSQQVIELSKSPIVVIELGGNDSFKPTTTDEYQQMVLTAMGMFRNQHLIFITFVPLEVIDGNDFWTPPVVSAVKSYNTRLLELAVTYDLDLVRWDLVPYTNWQTDTIDGVHRTQDAMELLLQPLSHAISKACKML